MLRLLYDKVLINIANEPLQALVLLSDVLVVNIVPFIVPSKWRPEYVEPIRI